MQAGRILTLALGAVLALFLVAGGVQAKDKKEALFPNATRAEPKLDPPNARQLKKLNEGLDAANEGDLEKATQLLQPFADGSESKSRYAQSLALQALANLRYGEDDLPGAIGLLKNSLDIGALPNDTYFQLKYQLAQFYVGNEDYEKALETLAEWRREGKRETADSYALEGNIDYRLEKYDDAIAALKKAKELDPAASKPSWDQILVASYSEAGRTDEAVALAREALAKNPDDTATLRNTVAMLVTAQKYPEAIALLEDVRAKGGLKEDRDWINLAKIYLVMGQDSDDPKPYADKAVAALEDALAKGVMQPGYDVYRLQGDAANIAGNDASALAYYRKALPFANDGETELRIGQILINEGKSAEGKKAVESAIKKGVRQEGGAYMLIAAAENNANNRAGAIAAMRKAATYPETKAKAEAWLKTAGAK